MSRVTWHPMSCGGRTASWCASGTRTGFRASRGCRPRPAPPLPGLAERPANGAELAPTWQPTGRGELTIANDSPYDAEVKLVMAGGGRELCRHVFVRARSQHTVRGVPPGSYDVLFRAGEDWGPAGRGFSRVRAVARLDRPLRWEEVETATEVRSQKRRVSLQVTPSPDSGLSPLADDEFGRIP